MLMMQLAVIVITALWVANAKPAKEVRSFAAGRQERILLHTDGDVMDVLAKTQAAIAMFNSTLMNLLATTGAKISSMNSTINLQNG